MTPAQKFLGKCGLIVIVGYIAFSWIFPTYRVRYELTLEVEENGKPELVSQVIEVRYAPLPDALANIGQGRKFGGEFRGAAPTIDLGDKGLVFIVNRWSTNRFSMQCPRTINGGWDCMRSVSLADLPLAAFGYPIDSMPSGEKKYLSQLQLHRDTIDVPVENLPMLVHFQNDSDRKSLEEVDPRDFAKTFGSGYRLLGARLKLTNAPISRPSAKWPSFLTKLLKDAKERDTVERLRAGESLDEVSGTITRLRHEQIYISDFMNE